MKFNPNILTRVSNGDLDALDALVEFGDGTVKRLAECDSADIEVMKAFAVYKSADVPRQVVGRDSSISKLGMVGSARPMCTSIGRFQAIAS